MTEVVAAVGAVPTFEMDDPTRRNRTKCYWPKQRRVEYSRSQSRARWDTVAEIGPAKELILLGIRRCMGGPNEESCGIN